LRFHERQEFGREEYRRQEYRSSGVQEFRSSGVQETGVSGVAEFRSGSPVRLDCARIGNKQLGDLFQKMLHLCCGVNNPSPESGSDSIGILRGSPVRH
jgi:hypothetical protein